ncbi:MAG: Rnf-Nqr domain containing protein [Candidatus Pseudomonas colombiensis]|jgi:Na+-translocating ferredoxin:NAD+ oxidoreductase subunit E|uniref:NADH:quinone oxidoreductase n=1 Tax=Pseudomonas morbosilactucae TaxID=2938197 RepID=A0ABT0JIY6_9PSED|nr:Rnf-Nqr domain containing protein [Pseudomonas morbosilactucae]MCK9815817.1 NADH:quinone oxidoreductase [Pseudomonas morbosilactucae]WEK08903.1 MAG: Rnf-Nqr domain containing protein [Pseudomonas sp.]
MNKASPLLGTLMLTPLVGASDSLVNALGLALAFAWVMSLFGLCMVPLRARLNPTQRLLASVLLSASLVSCVLMGLQAWAFELHQHLALYLGLLALQCVVLEQTHFFQTPGMLRRAAQFCCLLIGLGALREALGGGVLGQHLQWLAGINDTDWPGWRWSQGGPHLLLLAPGGFILLGLLLAAKNAWTQLRNPH